MRLPLHGLRPVLCIAATVARAASLGLARGIGVPYARLVRTFSAALFPAALRVRRCGMVEIAIRASDPTRSEFDRLFVVLRNGRVVAAQETDGTY
jgi:hypothetical protein